MNSPSDAQPVAPTKPRCAKPGCGALHIVGHPCTDWDCPQQYVSAADYRAVESALDAERQKREAAEREIVSLRSEIDCYETEKEDLESEFTKAEEYHASSLAKANARIADLEAALRADERLYQDGILTTPAGQIERVHAMRRASLTNIEKERDDDR
jgi:chromosome segregation ATPase